MLLPVIMAIWYGYRARKAGKSVILWALAGAALTFVVTTVLANLGILFTTGGLTGRIDFGTYMVIRVITIVLGLGIMILLGRRILRDTDGHSVGKVDSEAAKRVTVPTRREWQCICGESNSESEDFCRSCGEREQ